MPDLAPPPATPTQRALKWTIFLGATAFVVYLCLRILAPFLNVIAWAAVLSITFYPLHRDLRQRLQRPALSALLCSAVVIVAFLIPLLFVVGVAVDQLLALGQSLQKQFADQIRATVLQLRELQDAPGQDEAKRDELVSRVEWETRVFEERQKTIGYVCEVPVLIEQRLFALARAIQQALE